MRCDLLKRRVQEEDPQGAKGEEHSEKERRHVLHFEELGRKQGHVGDPSFDVHGEKEQDHAENEEGWNVWCLPTIWCVRAVGDGVYHQYQSR